MNNKNLFRLFRAVALITALSLFAVITFETLHAGHEEICHEEDCAICLVLQIIHSTNKIGNKAAAKASEFINFYYISILILSALLPVPATLVKQKVKLVI